MRKACRHMVGIDLVLGASHRYERDGG
jgi:hypothetical protein